MTDRLLQSTSAAPRSPSAWSTIDGTLTHHAKLPTPDGDAETVWAVVDSLITEALATAGGRVRGVGISCGGPIDLPSGTVSPINITEWQRFPIVDRVSAVVGAPVRLGGDGLCMALGERWRGAGRQAKFMLGMVVSTGVGGGLVLDGAPYDGRTGNAGHVGHVVVDPDGGPCTCGGRGCVETIAAGPRMAQWAREHGWDAPAEADAKELADAAECGRRGRAAGVQAGRDGRGGDDRVRRRGLRPRPRRHRRRCGQFRCVCCSTRCARRWTPTRASTSSAACGSCPPSSAATPAWSAPPPCCARLGPSKWVLASPAATWAQLARSGDRRFG